jgi:hypothetical protein
MKNNNNNAASLFAKLTALGACLSASLIAGCSPSTDSNSTVDGSTGRASRAALAQRLAQARFKINDIEPLGDSVPTKLSASPSAPPDAPSAPAPAAPAGPATPVNAANLNTPAPPAVVSGAAVVKVSAGSNLSLTLPDNLVLLNGSSDGIKVNWSLVSPEPMVVIESPNAPITRVKALKAGSYTLRLTATGKDGSTQVSDMVLDVKANPTILSELSTPLDHLKAMPKPTFKSNHTMLPLGQSSCGIHGAIEVELMKNWGYAAQDGLGGQSAIVQSEVNANPGKYPLEFYVASLYSLFNNYSGTNADYPVLANDTWLRDSTGSIILENGNPIISPLMSESSLLIIGKWVGAKMALMEQRFNRRIDIVHANGEHGLALVFGNDPTAYFGRDPSVLADYQKAGVSWEDYLSKHKARHERTMKDGMFSMLKLGKPVYSYYGEGYQTDRGRWWGWKQWMPMWEYYLDGNRNPTVSDYSSPEMYYNFHNTGWTGYLEAANVPYDALTTQLKNVGGGIKLGQKFIYPWVSNGWDGGDSGGVSDDESYVGMLKMLYTLGARGAVAGYFTCDTTGGSPFRIMLGNQIAGRSVPTQVRGFNTLAHVHALFTQLEPLILTSDLLLGVNNHPYTASVGGASPDYTPGIEFAVENELKLIQGLYNQPFNVPTARVVARKVSAKDVWLVTAWANTGNDRTVSVTIDARLGKLNLLARRSGSVYLVELKNGLVSATLQDEDAMNPTAKMFP